MIFVDGLAKDALEIRDTPPGPSSSITIIQIPDKKERECTVCSDPKGAGRKRSRNVQCLPERVTWDMSAPAQVQKTTKVVTGQWLGAKFCMFFTWY